MKILSPVFGLLFLVFMLASCHKTDKPVFIPFISAGQQTWNEGQPAGKDSLTVHANIELKLTGLPPYVTTVILPDGPEQYKIVIAFTENTDTATRKCDIILSGKNDSINPVILHFYQGGSQPFIIAGSDRMTENPSGQTDSLIIRSNIKWQLINGSNVNWITSDRFVGDAGNSKVMFAIDTNKSLQARGGYFILSNPDGLVPPIRINFSQGINYNISSFSPSSGTPGAVVTIKGIFGSNPVVKINGAIAELLDITANQITFIVPANASTGKITVSFANKVLTSVGDFTFYNYSISNFTPLSGQPGTAVTINGTFGPDLRLQLNGQDIPIQSYTPNRINFVVPSSAHTGFLRVISGAYTIKSAIDFIVGDHNTWAKIADGHGGFYQNGVSFKKGNLIYNGLGYSSTDETVTNNDFRIFDTRINHWQHGPAIPSNMPQRGHASCFAQNGKFYMGFGVSSNSQYADWWSYDPAHLGITAWKKLTSYTASGSSGLAFVLNNNVYAGIPYWDGGKLDLFDITANAGSGAWSINTILPKIEGATSFILGDEVYFSGGNTGNGMYSFNPATSAINNLHPTPEIFEEVPSFTLGSYGYVLTNSGKTYKYDPSSDSWAVINIQSPITAGIYNAMVVEGVAYAWKADGTMYEFVP